MLLKEIETTETTTYYEDGIVKETTKKVVEKYYTEDIEPVQIPTAYPSFPGYSPWLSPVPNYEPHMPTIYCSITKGLTTEDLIDMQRKFVGTI